MKKSPVGTWKWDYFQVDSKMRLIQIALLGVLLALQLQLHPAAAEPPSNFTASAPSSTESNTNLESSTGSTLRPDNGKNSGKDPQDLKPYLEPPTNKKRRPFWRSRYWPRRPFSRPKKEQQKEKEQQASHSQPQPTPTPDPAALTNFLAAAAFLLQNQNKFNNQPAANSISSSQLQQPLVGPFTYSQVSNVYKDGQPIPMQTFSSFSGPSPSFSSPSGPSSSSPFVGSGPSSSSVVGPSGFSAGRPGGNGFQSHYTNPNASPYQPSSIATSFFSRPPPQGPSGSAYPDYETAKSLQHTGTVLPSTPPISGTHLFSSSGPTAASNLSPQTYAVTSAIQTGPSPSAPGASIHYITPTPHKPYAVTYELGHKLHGSQMLNTNQLLTDSERFFKHFNKNEKNVGGLPPDQFLKTVSLTGGSSSGSVLPLSYSGKYVQPSSSAGSSSPAAISNLEEKMNLLLNLVPHLVRSGALPADSLLAPTLDMSKYVPPPSTPSLSMQDLLFLKLRAAGVAMAPPKTSVLSSPGSLEPHESAYYSPSSSSSSKHPVAVAPLSPLLAASAPSYRDFDSMYDLLANPSSSGTVIRDGPPSSSVEVSDPVIIYHHHGSSSSSPYSSPTHSHSHQPSSTSAGHHPFAPPSSSSLLSSLNDDRPRSAIGSLLSSVRKMIF